MRMEAINWLRDSLLGRFVYPLANEGVIDLQNLLDKKDPELLDRLGFDAREKSRLLVGLQKLSN